MNDIVKAELLEPAQSQLITLKPEKYVSEIFSPFKTDLKKAVKAASVTPAYDITTTAGLEVAKRLRASFRTIRTTAENTRKERKAPIIQIGKLLDSKYAELEKEIREHEDKYDAEVKSEEERKERIKQEELARERARVEAIENRLNNIRIVPSRHLQSGSGDILKAIEQFSTLVLDPADYDEYHEDALHAVNAVLVELERMRKIALDREIEARRIEEERAELARLKAEKEEIEARLAEQARQRAEEDRREREAAAAREAEQARIIAELQAQLAAAQAPAPEVTPEEPAAVTQEPFCFALTSDNQIIDMKEAIAPALYDAADTAFEAIPAAPDKNEIILALMDAFQQPSRVIVHWLNVIDFTED